MLLPPLPAVFDDLFLYVLTTLRTHRTPYLYFLLAPRQHRATRYAHREVLLIPVSRQLIQRLLTRSIHNAADVGPIYRPCAHGARFPRRVKSALPEIRLGEVKRGEVREGGLGVRDVRNGEVRDEGWEGLGRAEEKSGEGALTWRFCWPGR